VPTLKHADLFTYGFAGAHDDATPQKALNHSNGRTHMNLSIVGLAVFTVLFVIGWGLGSGALVGLMASLPFGSTAFVRLPWLGGATPLLYVLFAVILLAKVFLRGEMFGALRAVFARQRSAWIVVCLMLLAIAATIFLPRIFAGETVGLLPVDKNYREFPLHPSSKNVTQGGYFLLGTLVYFAVSIMLLDRPRASLIFKAFAAFCIAHTACGLIDLLAKLAGESDVFALIRTAEPENAELIAVGNAVCASALGWLVGVSISAGSADPGIGFFVALAVTASWRRYAEPGYGT
jgi:hypothetical protein